MNQKKTREFVEDFLLRVGVAPSIKGFAALREVIMLAVEQPKLLDAIVKELYPAVAEKLGTTASRAERAMRHAIECCFDRGDVDEIIKLCKVPPRLYRGKYTNSEFISVAVLQVRREVSA